MRLSYPIFSICCNFICPASSGRSTMPSFVHSSFRLSGNLFA